MLKISSETDLELSVTLNITVDEETEIAAILGCSAVELNARLNACTGPAINEYLAATRQCRTHAWGLSAGGAASESRRALYGGHKQPECSG